MWCQVHLNHLSKFVLQKMANIIWSEFLSCEDFLHIFVFHSCKLNAFTYRQTTFLMVSVSKMIFFLQNALQMEDFCNMQHLRCSILPYSSSQVASWKQSAAYTNVSITLVKANCSRCSKHKVYGLSTHMHTLTRQQGKE